MTCNKITWIDRGRVYIIGSQCWFIRAEGMTILYTHVWHGVEVTQGLETASRWLFDKAERHLLEIQVINEIASTCKREYRKSYSDSVKITSVFFTWNSPSLWVRIFIYCPIRIERVIFYLGRNEYSWDISFVIVKLFWNYLNKSGLCKAKIVCRAFKPFYTSFEMLMLYCETC